MSAFALPDRQSHRALATAAAAWIAGAAAAQAADWSRHEVTVTLVPLHDDPSKGVPDFRVTDPDPVFAAFRPGREDGVVVVEVYRHGATAAVMQRGDIITAAAGLPMNLAKDFATLVTSFPPGTRLKLEFWRYRDGFAQLQADLWRRAQANEAVATYVLGYLERNPEAGNPDHARAFGFFHRAAALGHVRAMEMVGFAYRAGRGTDKNLAEATKWYRRAAEAGSAGGMVSLGILIATGEAGAPDPAEAFRWFERSAAGGNAAAHYLMANYLDTGRGTARDRDAGAKHLIEAARGGSTDALTQFTSETSKWKPSAEFVTALQRRLVEAGAYHGPLDGRPSADVAAALSRLQSGRKP